MTENYKGLKGKRKIKETLWRSLSSFCLAFMGLGSCKLCKDLLFSNFLIEKSAK